jgi:hypothetical protein
MPIRRGKPLKWSPQGLSDCLDSTTVFPGAMSSLANLIPDPQQIQSWLCRPAAVQILDFSLKGGAFSTAFSSAFDVGLTSTGSFVSALIISGVRAYGMIQNSHYPGFDSPFSYNLVTGTFDIVSGTTLTNLPSNTLTTGAWTPPTMDIIGSKIIVTHPGFSGSGSNFFGVIDISTPTSPTWTASNTTTNVLPAVPTAVKQFNNRAWFAVNPSSGTPGLYFSDVLAPTTITAGTQVLTFGDTVPITAIGALPLNNQLGGIIQALIVFKGITNMVQVTGDAAATPNSTLSQNALNVATGTLAPNSICSTPKGLAFIAPDGLRIIDFNAQVSDPIGISGSGVTVPFIYSVVPSRMAAAYNAGVIRISVQNGFASASPTQEYWYDMSRSLWTGPHSFPASLIRAYSNTFIMTPVGVGGKLFQSDPVQSSTSTYVENGTQLSYTYKTPLLPNTGQMAENSVIESTIDMALSTSVPVISVTAIDHDGTVLASVLIASTATSTSWGAFTWGSALWGGAANALRPRRVDWPNPIVADQFYVQVTGNSAQGVGMGKMYFRYEILGYLAA